MGISDTDKTDYLTCDHNLCENYRFSNNRQS